MKTYYFPIVSSLLLVLSVIAFSDNLFTDISQESNRDPKFIIHGVLMFAWFRTFVAQSVFILRKQIRAHIRWGKSVSSWLWEFYAALCMYLLPCSRAGKPWNPL